MLSRVLLLRVFSWEPYVSKFCVYSHLAQACLLLLWRFAQDLGTVSASCSVSRECDPSWDLTKPFGLIWWSRIFRMSSGVLWLMMSHTFLMSLMEVYRCKSVGVVFRVLEAEPIGDGQQTQSRWGWRRQSGARYDPSRWRMRILECLEHNLSHRVWE